MKINRIFIYLILPCFILLSCKDKKDKLREMENIYLDYKITGDEGYDNVTVKLQFKDIRDGDALHIPGEGFVELDGEKIIRDSSKLSGYFYELHKPLADFTGKHRIRFVNSNDKEYIEEFEFNTLQFISNLPDSLGKDSITFEFAGVGQDESLSVETTDTSFINNDLNLGGRKGNKITLDSTELESIAPGPVQFEFSKTMKRRLTKNPGGGQLLIIYNLKREYYIKSRTEQPVFR